TSVSIKKVNDVMRLQALIDRSKVIIIEDTVRQALCLDDADGVDCLPNEEFFAELARIGAKRTVWNEFSSSMASAVICLATGVETPLFEGMLVAREPENQGNAEEQGDAEEHGNDDNVVEEPVTAVDDVQPPPPQQQSPPPAQPHGADFPMSLLQEALDACAALARRVEHLEHDKRIESSDDTIMEDMSNQGRMIDESDKDEEVVDAVSETVSAAAVVQADIPAAPVNAAVVVTTAAPIKMEEEERKAIALINETPAQKAAKRRRLNKEID
nr:hypothetical protein [Tanacetum cinerariifolium]